MGRQDKDSAECDEVLLGRDGLQPLCEGGGQANVTVIGRL